jgi:hypothetical protein
VKPVDIDSPIRLDRIFWLIYFLVGLPCLLFIRPVLMDEPPTTRVAGYILLPFLIAIVVYTFSMFIAAVFLGGPGQRREVLAFLITMGIVSLAFGLEWAVSGFKDLRWSTPAVGSFAAIILYGTLSRRSSNHVSDPTLPPDTPPAGQEERRRGCN